jgi:hypothetical protein
VPRWRWLTQKKAHHFRGRGYRGIGTPIDQALAMIVDGRIVDAKTIMLPQYAALNIFR